MTTQKKNNGKMVSKTLTKEQQAKLDVLGALSDNQIDTSDIPEIVDFSGAKRGVFHRPTKEKILF